MMTKPRSRVTTLLLLFILVCPVVAFGQDKATHTLLTTKEFAKLKKREAKKAQNIRNSKGHQGELLRVVNALNGEEPRPH